MKFMFCQRRVGQPGRSVPELKLLEEICRLQFNLETGSSVSGIDKKRGGGIRAGKKKRKARNYTERIIPLLSLLLFDVSYLLSLLLPFFFPSALTKC
jgi:hypothetical protein